jgi:glycosyltransferase involved in cell wall biosynthesis
MKEGVSCIIAAYNEEKRISPVLSVVTNHSLINEIIVVNDGSKDNTKKVIRNFKGIKLINLNRNYGKSFAVMKGLEMSKNKIILLVDADLVGLTEKDLTSLILPVKNKEVSMSLSLRRNPFNSYLMGIDILSGERVFDKNLLEIKELKKIQGYKLESYINSKVIQEHKSIRVIKWKNVYNVYKSKKIGFLKGIIGDVLMNLQINPFREIYQIICMRNLRR